MPSRAVSASWPDFVLAGSAGTLALLAWLVLWWWGKSPSGHLLMHGGAPPAGGSAWFYGAIFVLGWTLMTVAMMLPTTVPLLVLFRRLAAGRANTAALVSLLIAGYLAAWTTFGAAAGIGNQLLQRAMAGVGWLDRFPWVLVAGNLTLAGLYQFSPLKYACLEKCRTPMSFLMSHWHGLRPKEEAFRIGVDHGIFCVGCCWSLMLLMFVMGTGSLGGMFLLGVVMALEKNSPYGRRLSGPIGGVLLAGAAWVIFRGLSQAL